MGIPRSLAAHLTRAEVRHVVEIVWKQIRAHRTDERPRDIDVKPRRGDRPCWAHWSHGGPKRMRHAGRMLTVWINPRHAPVTLARVIYAAVVGSKADEQAEATAMQKQIYGRSWLGTYVSCAEYDSLYRSYRYPHREEGAVVTCYHTVFDGPSLMRLARARANR